MSAKKRTRRGKAEPGFHRTWHELVQKPKRVDPPLRTGDYYKREFPQPTIVVEPNPDYRGGRQNRPHAEFTNDLQRRSGEAMFRRAEQSHPVRRAQRNERRRVKQLQALAAAEFIAATHERQAS